MDILDLPYIDKIDMDVGMSKDDKCEFCPMLKYCENDSPKTDYGCDIETFDNGDGYYSITGWDEFHSKRFDKVRNRWSEKDYEKTELEVYLSSE